MQGAFKVWLVAFSAYFLAVFSRSSLAVAGLVAAERYGISASQLATFTMVQLLVYTLMQVPVGVLVDRFGPRAVMLTGMLVMAIGQAGFALADSYALAVGARVLVGLGDALTFICMLRLIASWFGSRHVGLLTTLSGSLGQLGTILAAVPMTWALSNLGWTTAYAFSSVAGVVLFFVGWFVLRDSPARRTESGAARPLREIGSDLMLSWRNPGTRLAFWIHFSTPFTTYVVSMLWGLPFFVRGQGQSDNTAGILISVITATAIIAGPIIGWLMGKYPYQRSTMALGFVALSAGMWAVVLLWSGPAPIWLLVALAIAVGTGGPASMIGFDVARTTNPPDKLASASGIVNQGGFIASLIVVVGVGWVLDLQTPSGGTDYTLDAFRWAFALQYLLWGFGAWQIWKARKEARATLPPEATGLVVGAKA